MLDKTSLKIFWDFPKRHAQNSNNNNNDGHGTLTNGNGFVDEIRYYEREIYFYTARNFALTPAQVKDLYFKGSKYAGNR